MAQSNGITKPPMTPADPSLFFKGRKGDRRLGECFSIISDLPPPTDRRKTMTIIGAPDDTGVRLNRGRGGAQEGPDAIRAAFYKFAVPMDQHFDQMRYMDAGNIIPVDDIIETHARAFAAAQSVTASGSLLIALGGGHDFAAPHILGAFSGIKTRRQRGRCGIINVDPHLDVRELENFKPHSGTPFRQILESGTIKGDDLVQFGARNGRNAPAHFDFCRQHGVSIHEFSVIRKRSDAVGQFKQVLAKLSRKCQDIAVTIDMDSCAGIEGVSAAPVIGFSAWELCQFAYLSGKNANVCMMELAEIAPNLDPTGRAPRIAAEVLFHFLLGQLERRSN
jgi:formiminoglutamase